MKHVLRFACGGVLYFFVEVIWRIFMNHGEASFLMAPMAGIVCVTVMALYDKKLPIILGSLVGAVVTTLLELIVGSIALYGFNRRFWYYGRINWNGIIALDWFFKWWAICFGVLLARWLLELYLKRRKQKDNNGKAV